MRDIDAENCRTAFDGRRLAFPFANGVGADVFLRGGDVAGDGEQGVGTKRLKHLLKEFQVAVGGLDEYLRAAFDGGLFFIIAQGADTFGRLDREVAVE